MDKNKKEKLVPVVVRISQESKNKIKELSEKQGKTEADIIREGIERIINMKMLKIHSLYLMNKEFVVVELG